MLPSEFFYARVVPDIIAAADADAQTPPSELDASGRCRVITPSEVQSAYRSDDPRVRASAAVAARLIVQIDEETLRSTFDVALQDKDTLVRGFAWWAIAQHSREYDSRVVLLSLLAETFPKGFGIELLEIPYMAVHSWLDSLHYEVNTAVSTSRFPAHIAISMRLTKDPAFAAGLRTLSQDPNRAQDLIRDPSPAKRFAVFQWCEDHIDAPPLNVDEVRAIAQNDPVERIRTAASQYLEGVKSNHQ